MYIFTFSARQKRTLTLIMKYNDKLSLFLYNIVCKYFKRQDIYEYKKLKKHFLLTMPPGDAFREVVCWYGYMYVSELGIGNGCTI